MNNPLIEFAFKRKETLAFLYNELNSDGRGRVLGSVLGGLIGRLGASLIEKDKLLGMTGGAGIGALLGNRLPKAYTQKRKSLRNLYERP